MQMDNSIHILSSVKKKMRIIFFHTKGLFY